MIKLLSDKNSYQRVDANLLVGQRIHKRRKELEVTATDLAKWIGISQQQLSRYERGTNRINVDHLISICVELNTPVGWFFIDCISNEEKKKNKVSSHISVEDAELKERFEQIWPRLSHKQHRTLILFLDEHLKA
ncbi:helix-turn-helix domain-containing protein [Xenorhabdus bovienii]|uniref:helix-turn-helix domain-containing protein n=1 Tax=Xenorhabdus bovienii TaxID=40576 RepID=UPI0023B2BB65|nr:helix-turn-helix transcriptional regulator [Xenorhabdus bovienii]MDE9429855.1 helix-turn-helix transcriptional regulator [Xenorhabdus bovienii]MDE9488007.1 helix-turn-helix transcriptional regulator [Xenorhabdus bovienii]